MYIINQIIYIHSYFLQNIETQMLQSSIEQKNMKQYAQPLSDFCNQQAQNNKGEDSLKQGQDQLQLMVRAHQRIRTLEDDNKILRMHIELLSKDNKQLLQTVQKLSSSKKHYQKQNQNLANIIGELRIQLKQAKNNPIESYSQHRDLTNMPDSWIQRAKRYRIVNQLKTKQIQNRGIHNAEMENKERKTQQIKTELKNDSIVFLSDYSNDHAKSYGSQKDQIKRSSSHSAFQYHEHDSNKASNQICTNHAYANQNIKTQLSKTHLRMNSTHDSFNSYKLNQSINNEVRCSSPLIRKNSVSKQKIKGQSNFYVSNFEKDSPIGKRFSYTNWRKSNSNLMVWRSAAGTNTRPNANKQILLNR